MSSSMLPKAASIAAMPNCKTEEIRLVSMPRVDVEPRPSVQRGCDPDLRPRPTEASVARSRRDGEDHAARVHLAVREELRGLSARQVLVIDHDLAVGPELCDERCDHSGHLGIEP